MSYLSDIQRMTTSKLCVASFLIRQIFSVNFPRIDDYLPSNSPVSACHHRSVDSYAPSILQPWVRVPSTPFSLLSIYILIESCGKGKNKQNRGLD